METFLPEMLAKAAPNSVEHRLCGHDMNRLIKMCTGHRRLRCCVESGPGG